jgi:hypothetical protein
MQIALRRIGTFRRHAMATTASGGATSRRGASVAAAVADEMETARFFFDLNGFVIARNALSPKHVSRLNAAVDRHDTEFKSRTVILHCFPYPLSPSELLTPVSHRNNFDLREHTRTHTHTSCVHLETQSPNQTLRQLDAMCRAPDHITTESFTRGCSVWAAFLLTCALDKPTRAAEHKAWNPARRRW